jgi:hypothetical protein
MIFPVGHRLPIEGFALVVAEASRPGVYGLTDPRLGHAVAYVGQSVNIMRRYFEHLECLEIRRREWIDDLKKAGLVPGLMVIEYVPRTDELLQSETRWIKLCKGKGLAWLNGPRYGEPPVDLTSSEDFQDYVLEREAKNQIALNRQAANARIAVRAAQGAKIYKAIAEARDKHSMERHKAKLSKEMKEHRRRLKAIEETAQFKIDAAIQSAQWEEDSRVAAAAEKLAKQSVRRGLNAALAGVRPAPVVVK